ncbi:MAG: hypothetical protein VX293_06065 [Candidatus Latescibacterota bacterium]|nr:hypothetical protein [Candidatus Latescibacterota bacterium]
MKPLTILGTCVLLLAFSACGGNPFAPEKHTPEGGVDLPPAPDATSPAQAMDNLARAMRDRDKDLYETLLDQDFWFTETDCLGDLVLANGFEEELEIMGGSRDDSQPGIFDIFREFEYDFELIRRTQELGPEFPEAFKGDPDGHPDEDWEVFRGRVEMLLLDENGDGFRVDQIMTYKLRLDAEGVWKVIRWIDDPLSGDCGGAAGKRPAKLFNWMAVKQHAAR